MRIENYEEARLHRGQICRVLSDNCYTGPNFALFRYNFFLPFVVYFALIGIFLVFCVYVERNNPRVIYGYLLLGMAVLIEFGCVLFFCNWHHYRTVIFVHVQQVLPKLKDSYGGLEALQFTVTVQGETMEACTKAIFARDVKLLAKGRASTYVGKPQYAGYDRKKDCWVILFCEG